MLWEHPLLAESLRKSFRSSVVAERSLDDSLLQTLNRSAYLRDFAFTDDTITEAGHTTYLNARNTLSATRNYEDRGYNLTQRKFAENPPDLMQPHTFSWDVDCWVGTGASEGNWFSVQYWRVDSWWNIGANAPIGRLWEGNSYDGNPTYDKLTEWDKWIYDDHHECCDESELSCLGFDIRNHVRVRYRAKITPDPLSSTYYEPTTGANMGEIYGSDSTSAGIIPHQLVIEADVATTRGDLGWFGLGEEGYTDEMIADFGIIIKNLTTGEDTYLDLSIVGGSSSGSLTYALPSSGLYYVFVYLKNAGPSAITVSTPLRDFLKRKGVSSGHTIKASHPMRMMLYVSPTPTQEEFTFVPVTDTIPEESMEQSEEEYILINDEEENGQDKEDNKWVAYVVGGLIIGSLVMLGGS